MKEYEPSFSLGSEYHIVLVVVNVVVICEVAGSLSRKSTWFVA
jgi:uncharacterized membrane protein